MTEYGSFGFATRERAEEGARLSMNAVGHGGWIFFEVSQRSDGKWYWYGKRVDG